MEMEDGLVVLQRPLPYCHYPDNNNAMNSQQPIATTAWWVMPAAIIDSNN